MKPFPHSSSATSERRQENKTTMLNKSIGEQKETEKTACAIALGKGIYSKFTENVEEKAKEREKQEEKRQLELGFCDAYPVAKYKTCSFKTELTIERHPLFVVNSFKKDWREHSQKVKNHDGETIIQRTQIGLSADGKRTYGVLKQKHQEAVYKLLFLWQATGRKLVEIDGVAHACLAVTTYRLVKWICNDRSAKSYERVRCLLQDLATIPISIENAFARAGISTLKEFRLLSFEWNAKRFNKANKSVSHDDQSMVRILICSELTRGFVHGNLKTLSLDTYLSVGKKGDKGGRQLSTARLLYPFLDHKLANKYEYNIALLELFKRFGLSTYKTRALRRNKITPSINRLNGCPIANGSYHLWIHLRDSSDCGDYILVARRKRNDEKKALEETAIEPKS